MHLNGWQSNRGKCIPNGVAIVSERTGVNNDPVAIFLGFVDGIDQIALVI